MWDGPQMERHGNKSNVNVTCGTLNAALRNGKHTSAECVIVYFCKFTLRNAENATKFN